MRKPDKQFFRYLAPNAVTFTSLAFGMLSIMAAAKGSYAAAGWFVIFSVLTDKVDGFVARLVKGTSEFGVQADSFADFLNFGIAPATVWYTYLTRPGAPLAEGPWRIFMIVAAFLWVLAVTFRLARYNIVGDDPKTKHIFFGVPTTLAGGVLMAFFLTLIKYGADPTGGTYASLNEPHLVPATISPVVWKAWPFLMCGGAFLMASAVKIAKLGKSKSKYLTGFIALNVLAGFVLGATRNFPEYLTFVASIWLFVSLAWGVTNPAVRTLRPPPIFPRPVNEVDDNDEDDEDDEDDETAEDEAAVAARSAR